MTTRKRRDANMWTVKSDDKCEYCRIETVAGQTYRGRRLCPGCIARSKIRESDDGFGVAKERYV